MVNINKGQPKDNKSCSIVRLKNQRSGPIHDFILYLSSGRLMYTAVNLSSGGFFFKQLPGNWRLMNTV